MKTRTRRRVRVRSALLLTLGACFLVGMMRMLLSLNSTMGFSQLGAVRLAEMLVTLLAFGAGAYLGLCVLDGDQRRLVPMRRLSRAQVLPLALTGVLLVCPVTLIHELLMALEGTRYFPTLSGPQEPAYFLAEAFKSALVVPVCEELFFRGYLLGALRPYGEKRGALVVSLCFALVHSTAKGGGMGVCTMTLVGLLLCLVTLRTGSLLAPILVHSSYNLTLIFADYAGFSGMLLGLTMPSCMLRLAGCAAFAAALKRAYAARGAEGRFELWEGEKPGGRETALLLAAAALLIFAFATGGSL